ncbi:hypothetical protein ACFYN0_26420 [Streptomyces sp. NPDC006704]|uniref:hypothetical protein n=1 Tax=Streptomyces sp. NPDC006704 TaxID=3364760 RepID=UPI00367D0868
MEIYLDHRPDDEPTSGQMSVVFVWAPEYGGWRTGWEAGNPPSAQDHVAKLKNEGVPSEYIRIVTVDYKIEEV